MMTSSGSRGGAAVCLDGAARRGRLERHHAEGLPDRRCSLLRRREEHKMLALERLIAQREEELFTLITVEVSNQVEVRAEREARARLVELKRKFPIT